MRYEPWMLAAIDQAGLNGIREEHIEAVARELLRAGLVLVEQIVVDSKIFGDFTVLQILTDQFLIYCETMLLKQLYHAR